MGSAARVLSLHRRRLGDGAEPGGWRNVATAHSLHVVISSSVMACMCMACEDRIFVPDFLQLFELNDENFKYKSLSLNYGLKLLHRLIGEKHNRFGDKLVETFGGRPGKVEFESNLTKL